MANAVNILFATPNFREVQQAIGSIGQSLDKLARAGQSASERQARAAAKGAADTTKAVDKSARDAAKAQERAARDAARTSEKMAREAVKSAEKAEKDKTKAAEREAAERAKIGHAEIAQSLRARRRERREAEAEHSKSLRDAESRAKSFGRAAGGSVARALGTAGRIAGTVATLGGGFGIADSLTRGVRDEATAGVIYRGASQKGDFKGPKDVLDLATSTAIKTGGSTDDILAGLDQFVRKTGDLGAAKGLLEDMARLSAATGTNFADMGNTAAEVQNQLGDNVKTMEVMRALAGQGKAGAIDIKDLGQYGGRLAASAAQFEGGLSGNIESFGAIAQLAKKLGGATDTAEATESVARLSSDMAKHAEGFKALGVEVYADKGKTKFRNAEDIITESVVKSKGNQGALRELFGERSIRAALGAQVAYSNAGGGTAGEAAIRAQFSSLKATTMTTADVDEGVRGRMAETDAKLNIAMEELRRTVNERLLPRLPELIDKVVQLAPALGRFLDFITSLSPWQGIGLLVGASIAKDIAAAGVGSVVAAAVQGVAGKILPSVAGSAAGAGASAATGAATGAGTAVGGATAAGGGVGLGALLGAGLALPAMMYGAIELHKGRSASKVADLIGSGATTTEEKQKKLASLQELVGRVDRQKEASAKYDDGRGGLKDTGNISRDEARALQDSQAAAASKNMEQLRTTIELLNRDLRGMSETVKEIASAQPPSGGPADPNHPSRGALAP